MNIFQRISKLISANINHMLDAAEDPEVMIKQLIREMEESIIELRRETVKAIGQKKQLEKKIHMAKGHSGVLENKAALALEDGDEEFARTLLAKKLDADANVVSLENELHLAAELAEKMKADLAKLEDQFGCAFFERRPDGMVATRMGQLVIDRTRSALGHLSVGARGFTRVFSQPENVLTMTHIRAYLALADAGSFVGAAANTGLSQTSVHRGVR